MKHLSLGKVLSLFLAVMTLLSALVVYALYADVKRTEANHRQTIILGRSYGEALWRATSAQRWWAEYANSLALANATHTSPKQLARHFQFFSQNLKDALGNTNSVTGFTEEAIRAISVILTDAESLHAAILAQPENISREALDEVARIKRSVGVVASRLGTFEYLAVADFREFDQGRNKAAAVFASLIGLIIMLSGMGLLFYRRAIFAEAASRRSRMETVGSLSAGHSHAIASIVAGMQIFLDLMRERKQNQDEAFSRIQQGLSQLTRLNSSLALISRGQEMNEEISSLEQCIALLSRAKETQRVSFTTVLEKDAASHRVPATSLGIVLRECLANAYRHSKNNVQQIEIRAYINQSNLHIEVLDRGSGLTSEVLTNAMQPFFSTSGEGHSGLGLASCLSIIERIGGRISIANRKECGARVFISVPLARLAKNNGCVIEPCTSE